MQEQALQLQLLTRVPREVERFHWSVYTHASRLSSVPSSLVLPPSLSHLTPLPFPRNSSPTSRFSFGFGIFVVVVADWLGWLVVFFVFL